MPYPVYDFGGDSQKGDRPVIHLAIANGFPPGTYRPLLAPFTERYRVVCLPPRALWTPAPPPESLASWRDMGEDLLQGLRQHAFENIIAIGHSMGGVASMLAAIAEPERFRALILLDPTLLPPLALRVIDVARALGRAHDFPLARGARRRRRRFASTEEAYRYWSTRSLFQDWPDQSVRYYAEGMTRRTTDGEGVELAWSPEWEARYYETIITDAWRDVSRLRGLLPVLAIQGAETDTFTDAAYRKFGRTLPEATLARIEGHGHLFPQTSPDKTCEVIEEWMNKLPGLTE